MDTNASETLDTLVAAIWGEEATIKPVGSDPEIRAAQNRALSIAIKAYLQSYLDASAKPALERAALVDTRLAQALDRASPDGPLREGSQGNVGSGSFRRGASGREPRLPPQL